MAMRERPGMFILNKQSDFGKGSGGRFEDGRLLIGNTFFSGLYDSRERGMRWYKLVLDLKIPVNSVVRITVFSSESREMIYGGRTRDISEMIGSRLDANEKMRIFSQFSAYSSEAAGELLLTSVRGRYLFFAAEVNSAGGECAELYSARLLFRPYLWVNYLPEIYRTEENSFIERYLAIFQSVYEQNERMIERAAQSYTAENASHEFLKWLSGWYCITETELWNEDQLRYIMRNAARIYSRLGSKEIIEELCGLYLGERPEIIEYYSAFDRTFKDVYGIGRERLFIGPYVFTVLIRNAVLSSRERETLARIIDSCRPAHMEANIIVLASDVREPGKLDADILDDGDRGVTLS